MAAEREAKIPEKQEARREQGQEGRRPSGTPIEPNDEIVRRRERAHMLRQKNRARSLRKRA